jgi:hypothetical protein
MLSFAVFANGRPAKRMNLAGAYLIGNDDVPLHADIAFKDGLITCKKRAGGPAGLALPWHVEDVGTVMLETGRVLDRAKPYVLSVELARGRLTRINQKIEDWSLLDVEGGKQIEGPLIEARELLIKALHPDDPAEASAAGDRALAAALAVSEDISRIHAEVSLRRRKASAGFGRRVFGCGVGLHRGAEEYRKRLAGVFDFVAVPTIWRDIEPREQDFNWKPLDTWVEWLAKKRVPIKGGPLLSFREANVPDWLHVWEHDFETIRDLAFEHVRRVITRYSQYIQVWDVVSGIHARNSFTFNFEQLMELTRMATAAAKQASPRCVSIINIVAPWGEYYARNQRTIPPILYAEMVMQGGLNFDALGLEIAFGSPAEETPQRDIFQVSSLIDQFGKLGKAIHLNAVQVPSRMATPDGSGPADSGAGAGPWDEQRQSRWLRQVMEVALSKTFVERVAWHTLGDRDDPANPHCGLLGDDFAPKPAYHELVALRADLLGAEKKTGSSRTSARRKRVEQ